LHASSPICIVTAKCNFKKIGAKVRARALLVKKYDFFDIKSSLTSLIALEYLS
jgi:hypothetical protein